MPTNRRRVSRSQRANISNALLLFLQTGNYQEVFDMYPDCPDKYEIFLLATSGKEQLKQIYEHNRDYVLTEWKLTKQSGLPWAENLVGGGM